MTGISVASFGQKNRYAVYFTDKDNSPYSINAPQEFLSERAIARRDRMGIPVVTGDLPVNPHYIDSLVAKGVEVHFTSRWFNLALIEANDAEVEQLKAIQIVDSIAFAAPGEKLTSRIKKQDLKTSAATDQQNIFHNIDRMHVQNITGAGVWIAVMDGGFSGADTINAFQHIFNDNRLVMARNLVNNDNEVYQFSDHGTQVLSLISAYDEGQFIGGAYDAHVGLFVTEDVSSEYRIEEYNWLFAAEMADSAGFDIINTALGYNTFDDPSMDYTYEDMDGRTTLITRASNEATARGILTVASAGNSGNSSWTFITAPADAFGNLSVGAVDEIGNKASFSSIGPSADGRIKPDIAALGVGVKVFNSRGSVVSRSGTSFSAPIATSIMAGVLQAFPSLTITGYRDLAFDWSSQSLDPDYSLGYGILRFGEIPETGGGLFLQVYPNPAKDHLNINTSVIPESVEIYNIQGRKLPVQINRRRLYIGSLAKGAYVLKIKLQGQVFVAKFIKE
ncbi:MAG: S8 family peptidase [Candidatus Cyclobacteriaceae bacterium M2_1C_046]